MINILVVDDLDLVRRSIVNLLADVDDINVIGEAESGEKALDLVKKLSPHVVLLDLRLPDISSLEVTHRILKHEPKAKILILTAYEDAVYPARLLHAGVFGYLTKDTGVDELIKAIRTVYKGERYISPVIAQKLVLKKLDNMSIGTELFKKLSDQELEIAIMIAQGKKTEEVVKKFNLSKKTANTYRHRIFTSLQVNGDVELALLAIRHGLIDA